MLTNRDITLAPVPDVRSGRTRSTCKPGRVYTSIKQPYFFSYVIDELEREYGANTVREGGLKVYTTIDPRLQRLANKAIRDVLPYRTDPAAAIVSVEPGTGAIRAMTAVVRSAGNQFNLAAQSARQAGSTFKTFVLASAIEQGVDPDSTYYDIGAVHVHQRAVVLRRLRQRQAVDGAHVRQHVLRLDLADPRDARLRQHRLRAADTRRRPSLRVADGAPARRAPVPRQAGRVDRARLAGRLAARHGDGVRDLPGDGHLREADGDHEGRAAGQQGRPDSGWGKPQTKRALSQGVAWKVNDVLGQNALYGTGAGSGDGIHPNAGKTGTTENHADAWFDGYTRQLRTVVWMGYPKGEIPMLDVHG